ncbi:MAG: acyl carrier protein [Solirubrobacteraceae bacterium]
MTSAADVRAFVLAELAPALEDAGIAAGDVGDELDLIDARIIDSLGMLEVIAAVEAHFGLDIDFEELDPEQLSAVGPFSRFVAAEARA